jgi:hypothetical protein
MSSSSAARNSDLILRTESGCIPMTTTQRLIETQVHQRIFTDDTSDTAIGTTGYEVTIRYTPSMEDVPQTVTLPIRADSPEQAKSQAIQVATDMGHTNISVVGVVAVPTPPKPEDKPAVNVQPGTLAGIVMPSDVHPGLSNDQVLLPGR